MVMGLAGEEIRSRNTDEEEGQWKGSSGKLMRLVWVVLTEMSEGDLHGAI